MTRTRVIAALVMFPIAVAAILLLPTPWLAALAALFFLGGLWEWLRLSEVVDTLARLVLLVANLLLMAAVVWASRSALGGSLVLLRILVVAGVGWWLLAMLWLRHYAFASDHDRFGRAFKLAAGTLAVLPAWAALALIHASDPQPSAIRGIPQGHVWLLAALATVWAADTGAYFAGRKLGGKLFGARKLAPRISPNKTIEGLLGGTLAAVLAACLVAIPAGALPGQYPQVALVALAAALFSVVGDLFESLLKRHVGAKDSGDLIPGHGGILDRIDGVLAALPVFALGKDWFGF